MLKLDAGINNKKFQTKKIESMYPYASTDNNLLEIIELYW